MKALVKKEPGKGIWMEEVAVPKVGVNDVLIKIKKTAICGTDLHIYKWDEWSQKTIKTPMTIGIGGVIIHAIPTHACLLASAKETTNDFCFSAIPP